MVVLSIINSERKPMNAPLKIVYYMVFSSVKRKKGRSKRKLIEESKDGLSARSVLICIYKRIREKKVKTFTNSNKIQFFIEDKD